jgi:hypothetical protein
MEQMHKDFLRRHLEVVIDHIHLKLEDYIISLVTKGILDFSMADRIMAEGSSRWCSFHLMQTLEKRGPKAFLIFINIIKFKNGPLFDILKLDPVIQDV